ncbi:hypothetical protein [Cryptosporangium minutisporangium]|uniref:Histidine kinase n=1 Tax=Cryptosporangium minutisporangium TaxID=113569 RepID=A0ABP6TAK1_9ACTN
MTAQHYPSSALAVALTAPYRRPTRTDRLRERLTRLRRSTATPRRVVLAALLVTLQATVFLLGAVRHAAERDPGTAIALGIGLAGAALVAYGLSRGNRVAYVMTLSYATVTVLLSAVDAHRPALGALLLLGLLTTTRPRRFFTVAKAVSDDEKR